jgi:hypothetical protein
VASRYNCVRFWRLPVSAFCWFLSLPVALLLRIRGPKLVPRNEWSISPSNGNSR